MKVFISFVIKEAKHILRDTRTMLILFVMPLAMMLIFGFAIRTDVKDVRTVVVTSTNDNCTRQIVQALDASEYFVIAATTSSPQLAKDYIRQQKADLILVFSPKYARHLYDGTGYQLISDGTNPNMGQQYAMYAQSIIAPVVASFYNKGYNVDTETTVTTKMLYNPQMLSVYNFVPGIMGMLLMLICAMMTSISIAREKERGTMEVLLVSPVRPLVIILAKAVPYMVLAMVILVIILLMSFYVLEVPLSGSLFWITATSLLYILLALSLGLFISNVAKSQMSALLISAMVLMMPTAMLSGMLFPISSMPEILQYLSCIMPARWYISAMRKLMIMGTSVSAIKEELAVLGGMTLLLLIVSLAKFKTRLE